MFKIGDLSHINFEKFSPLSMVSLNDSCSIWGLNALSMIDPSNQISVPATLGMNLFVESFIFVQEFTA